MVGIYIVGTGGRELWSDLGKREALPRLALRKWSSQSLLVGSYLVSWDFTLLGLTFFALSEICASFAENARVLPNTKSQSLFCVKLKVWSVKRGENYQVTPGCSSQSTHQAFLREKEKLMENMVLTGKCKWQWITGCFHGEKYLGFMKSGNVRFIRMNANWQRKEMFRISEHAKEWKFEWKKGFEQLGN